MDGSVNSYPHPESMLGPSSHPGSTMFADATFFYHSPPSLDKNVMI